MPSPLLEFFNALKLRKHLSAHSCCNSAR